MNKLTLKKNIKKQLSSNESNIISEYDDTVGYTSLLQPKPNFFYNIYQKVLTQNLTHPKLDSITTLKHNIAQYQYLYIL